MSLFLTPIIPEVYKSLEYRQKYISDNSKTAWFHDRTAWVRMTSMAEVNGNPDTRLDYILTSLDDKHTGAIDLYGSRNKPNPGIVDATIQNKGTMGSIREAQVNFTCWDLTQLEMLEVIYMTPGISILLEWGWNKTVYGDIIRENLAQNSPMFDSCVAQDAIRRIQNTGGHYDAMQGLITNFNWTARDDGGFDCTTTFASISETFLTMSTKSKSKNILRRGVKPEEDQPSSFEENILATIFTVIEKADNNDGVITMDFVDNQPTAGGKIKIDAKGEGGPSSDTFLQARQDRNEGFLDDPLEWLGLRSGLIGDIFGNEDNYYVTWEFFEQKIVNANLSLIPEKPTLCNVGKENKVKTTKGDQILLPVLYNNDVYLNYRKDVISSDPYVCILPAVEITGESSNQYYELPTGMRSDFPEKNKIRLSDILLNLKVILESYKNSQTINDFVLNILNSVSDACGGIWQFSLFIDEDQPTIIKVADNLGVQEDDPKPFKFLFYNRDSILTSYSLNSEVSNEFKASIMYGVNKKKTEGLETREKDTGGTTEYDFYGSHVRNLAANDLRPPEANELGQYDTSGKPEDVADPKKPLDWAKYLDVAFNDLFEKRTPDTVADCQKALNKYITEKIKIDNLTVLDKKHLILPIKMSVGLPGIAGIKFGNLIDVDYKPARYTGDVDFQITNVKQTISDGEWNTEIDTIMRVRDNYENFSPWVSSISPEEQANQSGIYGSSFDSITGN